MQDIRSLTPPVVTGICDPNNSRTRHHRHMGGDTFLTNPYAIEISEVTVRMYFKIGNFKKIEKPPVTYSSKCIF